MEARNYKYEIVNKIWNKYKNYEFQILKYTTVQSFAKNQSTIKVSRCWSNRYFSMSIPGDVAQSLQWQSQSYFWAALTLPEEC